MKIGLLLAPTYRSRAILQIFFHVGLEIDSAVMLPGAEPHWDGPEIYHHEFYQMGGGFDFYPAKTASEILQQMKVPFAIAPTNDVNTSAFIEFIQKQNADVYIYSGIAGCILRSELLTQSGKKFIHAHGGDAPRYSGSTAFYYSILENNTIGATVFWMDEGLDTGDVITKVVAPAHKGAEIDRLQDPLIRAEAFVLALEQIKKDQHTAIEQDHNQRVTYHVIHPILKHLALKKIEQG